MREKTLPRCHVRWTIRRDLPEILAIELHSFAQAWGEEDFLAVMRRKDCIGMVAEGPGRADGEVIGYMLYELRRHSIRLLNFAVSPARRREGVGSLLVRRLAGKLQPHRRRHIVVDVRESNLAAQLFFRSCGFRATGVVRGHYADTDEDAYRMVYYLEAE